MLLQDKVIVISGVGPGLGQTMAKIAVSEGAKVSLGARNKAFLDEVVAEVRKLGGEAIALSTDVTDVTQCAALANATLEAFGRIDGLVNSAHARGEFMPTDEVDADEFASITNVNCAGALRMAQACLSGLKVAGGGAIVNISTMSTVNPFPGEGAYAAGKGALNVLTRHMAKDFGRHNVRVNLTRMGWIGGAPVHGYIDGLVAAGRDRDEVIGEITERIPLGVIPPESDCAKSVMFLVSDYSKVITGASIDVNGGQYMAP